MFGTVYGIIAFLVGLLAARCKQVALTMRLESFSSSTYNQELKLR